MHRGGPLAPATHHFLAAWAADCAHHVLPFFTQRSSDDRPARAIEIARAWSKGKVPVGAAQKAAVAAHAAARAVTDPAAAAAARAAGHAVATAHMADHSLGASTYALKAVASAGASPDAERAWQLDRLPRRHRALIVSGLKRLANRGKKRSGE